MKNTTKKNNNYFAIKAAYGKVHDNLKAAHPDWTSKRVYEATKAIMSKRLAAAKA